jgi:hypothetical protein
MSNRQLPLLITLVAILNHFVAVGQNYRDQNMLWALHIGGPSTDESSWRIAVDGDGNAIIGGTFTSEITIGSTRLVSVDNTNTDAFIAKVSPNGSVIWTAMITGQNIEKIWDSRVVVDRSNAAYICFYSNSDKIQIAGKEVKLTDSNFEKLRIAKIQSNGILEYILDDSDMPLWGQGQSDWVQTHIDNYDNLIVSVKGWCSFSQLRKFNSKGQQIFRYDYPLMGVKDCGTPRIQSISTDRFGSIYTTLLHDDIEFENHKCLGLRDILIMKHDETGKVIWFKEIAGPLHEGINASSIVDGVLSLWGVFGIDGAGYSDAPVDFGGKSLTRDPNTNAFCAKYTLDGQLLSAVKLPFSFGYHAVASSNVDVFENGQATSLSSPRFGLIEVNGDKVTTYYKTNTYGLSSVCGSHYILGEFKDTIALESDRFRLVSRGGKDIYLALMKPASKYVPDRAGLREPLNSALNLDIPTVLEWWWVGCSNGHQLQVSRDSAMTQIVHDSLVTSGTKETLTNLSHSTTYYWRVRAVTADTFGMWSEVRSFTTVKAQPADVVLEYPANSSQGVVKTNTLRWTSSKRATNYIVDVAADSTFSEKVVNGKLVSSTTLDVSLESNKTYYWRVRAGNAAGTSPWSQVWTFTTRPDRPAATLLLSPSDRSTNEVVNTHFVWQSQGTGINYSLQVARDSSFQFKEVDINVMETAWRDTLEANTTYFWRVRASTPFESGDWSLPWSFTTGTVLGVDETTGTGALRVVYADGSLLISTHDESLSQQKVEVSIYTISGERILQSPMQFTSTPMRVVPPSMARGTYMVQIIRNDGSSVATSFMVK